MEDVLAYFDRNRARFEGELARWVKIPSISSDPSRAADVARNAEHLAAELRAHGAEDVQIWPTGTRAEAAVGARQGAGMDADADAGASGHPAVFASFTAAPGRPTLLVYGHHDVQPVEPLDEWLSPPFEPTIREGRMYGRGAVDDKGQVHIHVKAIEGFLRTRGRLPINLKFIVEGEEEIGSPNLDALLAQKAKELAADFVCVSDTAMFGRGIPSLCVGLRGMAYLEVHVTGPSSDQHSGTFGGGIANPVNALARLIAKLHDDDGRVRVPGFYDRVRALTKAEREEIASLPFDEAAWLASTGAPELAGERGFTTLERVWTRPSIDCNGIVGGFFGEGSKTIIPAKASAKISVRLVPDQEPEEIARELGSFLQSSAPPGVKVRVDYVHGGRPYLAPTDHPVFEVAKRAFARAFGRPTVFMREGGSIPFVRTIADRTGKPCLLMGFGQPDENSHAPNEWLDLDNYHLGIRSAAFLYDELSRL